MKHKRVFLIGFMCSGKTTVGKLLSRSLGWEFIDLDAEIERHEGMSIPDIFQSKGEYYFRELELKVLKEVASKERIVVSTGGGLGANPKAMKMMKGAGIVVWLRVSYEDFLKRCGNDKNRPMLKLGKEKLRELLKEREKVYSEAHLCVEETAPEGAVVKITNFLNQT